MSEPKALFKPDESDRELQEGFSNQYATHFRDSRRESLPRESLPDLYTTDIDPYEEEKAIEATEQRLIRENKRCQEETEKQQQEEARRDEEKQWEEKLKQREEDGRLWGEEQRQRELVEKQWVEEERKRSQEKRQYGDGDHARVLVTHEEKKKSDDEIESTPMIITEQPTTTVDQSMDTLEETPKKREHKHKKKHHRSTGDKKKEKGHHRRHHKKKHANKRNDADFVAIEGTTEVTDPTQFIDLEAEEDGGGGDGDDDREYGGDKVNEDAYDVEDGFVVSDGHVSADETADLPIHRKRLHRMTNESEEEGASVDDSLTDIFNDNEGVLHRESKKHRTKSPEQQGFVERATTFRQFTGNEDNREQTVIEIITNIEQWNLFPLLHKLFSHSIKRNYPGSSLLEGEFSETLKVVLTLATYMFIPNITKTTLIPMIEKEPHLINEIDDVKNWDKERFKAHLERNRDQITDTFSKIIEENGTTFPFSLNIWELVNRDEGVIVESFDWTEVTIGCADKYRCSATGKVLKAKENVYLLKLCISGRDLIDPKYFYVSKHHVRESLYLDQVLVFLHYQSQRSKFISRIFQWSDEVKAFPQSTPGDERMRQFMEETNMDFLSEILVEYAAQKTLVERHILNPSH